MIRAIFRQLSSIRCHQWISVRHSRRALGEIMLFPRAANHASHCPPSSLDTHIYRTLLFLLPLLSPLLIVIITFRLFRVYLHMYGEPYTRSANTSSRATSSVKFCDRHFFQCSPPGRINRAHTRFKNIYLRSIGPLLVFDNLLHF